MLTITIPGVEFFDEEKQEFLTVGDTVLELEHSLAAVSKWEQKFKKPFLIEGDKTDEEVMYYIRCMILTPNYPEDCLHRLTQANVDEIQEYINDKATATWFNDSTKQSPSRETLTSELIYYWLFAAGLDIQCENWHINRLFTILRIYAVKNSKPQKQNAAADRAQRRELNRQRRKQFETGG